jgi:hypothetical protein
MSMSVPHEEAVLASVRVEDAWTLVEELSTLARESGTEEERSAVARITDRLDTWGVDYVVHEPELFISLPRHAEVVVDGTTFRAKTPSMAASTPSGGVTAPLVYEHARQAADVNELFASTPGQGDVAGAIVLTEGLPMPGRITDLERRGAVGVVAISPGQWIHEGICTPIWGSPDLATWGRRPSIPVGSVSRPDGERIVDRVSAGEVEATLVAAHETGWRTIPVVVAELRGAVEPERFVLLHGHLDSWHVGVGDNATGDATLLETARVLTQHRDALARSVRIAWWSGHSHGRYAGSTWFADTFALDLEENCICHINCDSPGCRDADVFEDVCWMAETEAFARSAILKVTGQPSQGRPPLRAGDCSFNNLGVSTCFMLSSTMPQELRAEKGYYAVGGCGGNIEWHTEGDTLEIADRDRLLRDIRLYAAATFRAAGAPVHPLDFRATVTQLEAALARHAEGVGGLVDLQPTRERLAALRDALEPLYARACGISTLAEARPVNDGLLGIGRALVRVLYARAGAYRQDPALDAQLLPEFGAAAEAVGTVPDVVLRTELVRARNRLDRALADATRIARSCSP